MQSPTLRPTDRNEQKHKYQTKRSSLVTIGDTGSIECICFTDRLQCLLNKTKMLSVQQRETEIENLTVRCIVSNRSHICRTITHRYIDVQFRKPKKNNQEKVSNFTKQSNIATSTACALFGIKYEIKQTQTQKQQEPRSLDTISFIGVVSTTNN